MWDCMSHRGAGPRRSLQLPKVLRGHPLFPPALPARARRRRGPCGAAAIGILQPSSPAGPNSRDPAPPVRAVLS